MVIGTVARVGMKAVKHAKKASDRKNTTQGGDGDVASSSSSSSEAPPLPRTVRRKAPSKPTSHTSLMYMLGGFAGCIAIGCVFYYMWQTKDEVQKPPKEEEKQTIADEPEELIPKPSVKKPVEDSPVTARPKGPRAFQVGRVVQAKYFDESEKKWAKLVKKNDDRTFDLSWLDGSTGDDRSKHQQEFDNMLVPGEKFESISDTIEKHDKKQCRRLEMSSSYKGKVHTEFMYTLKVLNWERCARQKLYRISIEYTGDECKGIRSLPSEVWLKGTDKVGQLAGKISEAAKPSLPKMEPERMLLEWKKKGNSRADEPWTMIWDDYAEDARLERWFPKVKKNPDTWEQQVRASYLETEYERATKMVAEGWGSMKSVYAWLPSVHQQLKNVGVDIPEMVKTVFGIKDSGSVPQLQPDTTPAGQAQRGGGNGLVLAVVACAALALALRLAHRRRRGPQHGEGVATLELAGAGASLLPEAA